mmetsp:Transcript_1739/g.2657  ORF Transcript_1739/g.2657 Transcript_1739/m.2657 type:complete len:92 (+) Transcript_1739:133-408(+)
MTKSLEKAQTFNRLFNCIPLCLRLLYQRKGPRMEQRQKKHSSSFLVAHGPSATGIASNRQKEEEAKQFTQEVEARLEELTARRKKEIENVC